MLILENIERLYDGTGELRSAVHEGVDLLIEAGRIVGLRPHSDKREPGITCVDCSGLTVTPGLIDCHGHITILGLAAADENRMQSQAQLLYIEKILHLSLVDGGVTTMRDVGGATDFMKRMVDEGIMIGPRLKIAICMLSTTGGHADFRGPDRCHGEIQKMWGPAPGRPPMVVDGPWECRKRVREIAACGADLIKLCTSPGVASPSDRLENRDFSAEEVAAICDEAAARGLRVAAHAHSRSGIKLAIENGVHDIQHISFMDRELVEMAHERGCAVTPTSWVVQALPHAEGLSAFVMDKVRKVADVHAEAVDYARSGGLKMLGGTDPVLPGMHGRNYMELVALMRDGVPALTAWHGMTGLAAQEIGQTDAGTLEPGKRADLLVCAGDVLNQPGLLGDGALVEVVKDGIGYRNGIPQVPQTSFRSATEKLCGGGVKET
jgi:imidazolonepropionase-like amidohydrolase